MTKDKHQPDYFLLVLMGLILIIGLVFLNSASSVMGYKMFKNSFYYLWHQLLVGVLPGILLFILLYNLNLETIKKLSNITFLAGLALLVVVLLPSIGIKHGEAQRWINLGIFSFQPVEIFKLCLIIFLANFFSRREREMNNFWQTILPFLLIVVVSVVPIIFQKNFSAIIIVFAIALAIFWVVGGGWTTITGIFSLGLVSVILLIIQEPYRLKRIASFFSPNTDVQGVSYHVQQALIGVGSGGLFGLGPGYSRQKFFYLPESFGDSIFAIIAEEMGFIFTSLIIVLFFLLIWRTLKVAKNTGEPFSRLLAVGIAVWLGLQTIINMGGMLGILPITGVPLPLVSYGGSAMLANLAALGLLVNISKGTNLD